MGRGVRSSGAGKTRGQERKERMVANAESQVRNLTGQRAALQDRLRSARAKLGHKRRRGEATGRTERQIRELNQQLNGPQNPNATRPSRSRVTDFTDNIQNSGVNRTLRGAQRELAELRSTPVQNTPMRQRALRSRNNRIRNSAEFNQWRDSLSPRRRANADKGRTESNGVGMNTTRNRDIVQFQRSRAMRAGRSGLRAEFIEVRRQQGMTSQEAIREWDSGPGQKGQPRRGGRPPIN